MAKSNGEVRFHNEDIFSGQTGTVDHQNAVIRGVSVITGGITAEGHNLEVDDKTLDQIQACAKVKGKIPVCLDHGSGVKDMNGYLAGFRRDGNKVRADWHLLKSHDETPKMLERAEVMPNCFGMSTAFRPPNGNTTGDPIGGGKYAARCEKLMSVDCVVRPAANAGLFSVPPVDNLENGMAKEKVTDPKEGVQEGEPTLQEVVGMLKALNDRFEQQEQFNQQISDYLNQGNEPSLQDLVEASDEDLASIGLTREEVNAAVEEVLAGMDQEGQVQGQGQEGDPAGVEGQPAAAADFSPAGASAAGSSAPAAVAAMSSLQKQVTRLESKLTAKELKDKQQAEAIELASIEEKITVLAEQRNKFKELSETQAAEIDALRLHIKTGTRPVRAGVDNGMRMFSADNGGQLHEFQVRVKQLKESGKTEGEALMFAQKENPALHADWVQSLRKSA